MAYIVAGSSILALIAVLTLFAGLSPIPDFTTKQEYTTTAGVIASTRRSCKAKDPKQFAWMVA